VSQPYVDSRYGGFRESPGYQFRVNQALDQVARQGSVGGGLGGNTLAALSDRAGGLADQDFQQYLDNLSGVSREGQQALGSQLSGRTAQAGLSENFGSRLSDLASQYGKNQAGLITDAGTRQAGLATGLGEAQANIAGTGGRNLADLASQLGRGQADIYTGTAGQQAALGTRAAEGVSGVLSDAAAVGDAAAQAGRQRIPNLIAGGLGALGGLGAAYFSRPRVA
jgi:hypothetical protein